MSSRFSNFLLMSTVMLVVGGPCWHCLLHFPPTQAPVSMLIRSSGCKYEARGFFMSSKMWRLSIFSATGTLDGPCIIGKCPYPYIPRTVTHAMIPSISWHAFPPFQKLAGCSYQYKYRTSSAIIYCGVTASVSWSTPLSFAFAWTLGQLFVWARISTLGYRILAKRGSKKEHIWWDNEHPQGRETKPNTLVSSVERLAGIV